MPELPEVETTKRGIAPHIMQQRIENIIVRQNQLRWPIPTEIKKKLLNETITDVERRAKYLLIKTTKTTIIIHLGMSGTLRILEKQVKTKKHDHFDLVFADKLLRFNDPRRFGSILLAKNEELNQHPLLLHLGLEPLSKEFNGQYLWHCAQKKRVVIKSLLMDHHIVVGIGNIYAAEALFAARIYPASAVNVLTLQQFNLLARSVKTILKKAIEKGGTTLKDFMNSEGKPGYFANQLKVYGRAGLPCLNCKAILQSMIVNQRNTVFCPKCQPFIR